MSGCGAPGHRAADPACRRRNRPVLVLPAVLLSLFAMVPGPSAAQEPTCPAAAAPAAEEGWEAYGDGRVEAAGARFLVALERCPDHQSATTGLGYVRLRQGEEAEARRLFEATVQRNPESVDALVGLGLLAWRAADLEEVDRRFRRVLDLDPDHPTALEYMARLPEGLGEPPPRPPLTVPDTLVYPARTHDRHFDVRTPDGWEPFYVKGVNLGAALPGRYPSQFPDSARYARWIREMSEMGANTVRVYTIHPPAFYQALAEHNRVRPGDPLRLIHGVWTELPPENDYLDPGWEEDFFSEMRRVVDLVHGRADIAPRPGHASGFYTADVSPWVLAYVVGREWEPYSVVAFDSIRPDLRGFEGEYLRVAGGNAMDAWLGKAVEELVAYETGTYGTQRPVAYTNWPTLDPLDHPTETTVEEEVRLRNALGEEVEKGPREYDNDRIGLDASLVTATDALPAGYFASYHAYPYYPDFMILDPRYRTASSPLGPSNYFGYLRRLGEHHGRMPVIVAEYGVPASLGPAHLQPQGWHHGGHDEASMARADVRLTREIALSGMAGGAVFAWIDEWFKKNWLVIDFELPGDRNRLWLNRLDAEQHYGMKAIEPEPAVAGDDAEARERSWRSVEPLYPEGSGGGGSLRVASDAAHLWIRVDAGGTSSPDRIFLGFDIVDPEAGDRRWPGGVGPEVPVGLEFVLDHAGDTVRVLADRSQNPWRLVERSELAGVETAEPWRVERPPPGLFRARVDQRVNPPWISVPNRDGRYDSLRVISNRMRFGRDSTEFLAVGYDRGVLPRGEPPDGLWTARDDDGVLKVRIPWNLINVTDPSSRTILQGDGGVETAGAAGRPDPGGPGEPVVEEEATPPPGTRRIEGVRIVGAARRGSEWIRWPAPDDSVALYRWETWEEPEWRSRTRPVFDSLRRTFATLEEEATALPGVEEVPAGRMGAEVGAVEDADTVPDLRRLLAVADTAWRWGDQETARRLYDDVLAADSTVATALHRVALMEAWVERFDRSLELFDRLLERDPGNVAARVDRARVLAWSDELEGAIEAIQGVLDQNPGHPRALEALAEFQSWAGRLEASVSTYGQLAAMTPEDSEVQRARARVLSWASRFGEARAVYDTLLAEDPSSVPARLGLARVLAFSDRLDSARIVYRDVLDDEPSNVEALQGLARTLTWAGRLRQGERGWREALGVDAEDISTMVGLAQNLRWQGRHAEALRVLAEALAMEPDDPDVREQRRWALAAVSPRIGPSYVLEDDSDGNLMATTSLTSAWDVAPGVGLRVAAYRRDVEQGDLTGTAQGFTLSGSYDFSRGWTASAGVGGSEFDLGSRESALSYRASLRTPGGFRYGATLRHVASPLDATAALVRNGVFYRRWELDVRWSPAPAWRLQGSLNRARFEGSRINHRDGAALLASRTLTPRWTVGVAGRTFSYDRDLNDGYFDPGFYGIAEVTGRWEYRWSGWGVRLEAAPGVQQVGSDGEPAGTVRGTARLSRHVDPGRELFLSVGYSSTGLQSFSTGDSEYRYLAISTGLSWAFY